MFSYAIFVKCVVYDLFVYYIKCTLVGIIKSVIRQKCDCYGWVDNMAFKYSLSIRKKNI